MSNKPFLVSVLMCCVFPVPVLARAQQQTYVVTEPPIQAALQTPDQPPRIPPR